MVRFLARRLLSVLAISLAIIYFGFLAMNMIDNWQGEDPGYHLLDDARQSFADSSDFLLRLAGGDLGEVPTVSGPREMNEILLESYRNSMGILLMALAGATLLSLLLGSMAALTRSQHREYLTLLVTIVGVSAPSFLIAILLQQLGIKYTRTFGSRLVSMGGYAWDFDHLAMPLIVLAARPVAYLTRSAYLALGRIMEEDYIRTAYAKGLSLLRIVITHALRNFAIPFLTAVGVSLRFSLSSLPLVEFIFAWPGMGLRILEGIQQRIPLQVVSIALVIGLTIQLVGVLLEVSYVLIDPRIGGRG